MNTKELIEQSIDIGDTETLKEIARQLGITLEQLLKEFKK